MKERTSWVAVCKYPGKDEFMFHSTAFVCHWADLDRVAKEEVHNAWGKISPHDPPEIVNLIPGYLEYVKETR